MTSPASEVVNLSPDHSGAREVFEVASVLFLPFTQRRSKYFNMSSKSLGNGTSDPNWSKDYRDTKDVPWYLDSLDSKVTSEVSP